MYTRPNKTVSFIRNLIKTKKQMYVPGREPKNKLPYCRFLYVYMICNSHIHTLINIYINVCILNITMYIYDKAFPNIKLRNNICQQWLQFLYVCINFSDVFLLSNIKRNVVPE